MNLLPALTTKNLLDRDFHIRVGRYSDIEACNTIARQYPNELAWVRKASLQRGVDNQSLHVAIADGHTVGFVLFHRRLDGWQTVYDLAVDSRYTGIGIGRQLLYSVPCPIRLKVKHSNFDACMFYHGCGFEHIEYEAATKCNIYELRHLVTFCAGGNKTHPGIARQAGMAYGTNQFSKPYDHPFMLDVAFKEELQDWQDYMEKIRLYRPIMAMVTDYADKSEHKRLQAQIADLRAENVLRIMVCPKFENAIDDIPTDCIVALSVPTDDETFEGWLPKWQDFAKLLGRKVHLLGGAPFDQKLLINRVANNGGYVVSVDGNKFQKGATRGSYWLEGRTYRPDVNEPDQPNYRKRMEISAYNIVRYLNSEPYIHDGMHKSTRTKRIRATQLEMF